MNLKSRIGRRRAGPALCSLRSAAGLVLVLLALTSGNALAQDTVWTRRFDTGIPGWTDESGGATVDPFGDLIAVDALWNDEALESTYSYYVLVKYSPTGDTAWTRTRFCDSAAIVAGGIAADGVGNLAVVGNYEPLDDYRVAGEVTLYDTDGDSLWTRHIRIDDLTFLGAVAIDNSQNILVAGSNSDISRGTKDALLAKYSPGGELRWSRTLDFGRDTLEQLSGLCLDSDSGVVAVGVSGYRGGRSIVAGFSAAGDTIWTRQLDLDPEPAGHEFLNAVGRDPDGNFVACGAAWPGSGGTQRAVVVKFTPAGDTVWTSTFESEFDASAFDVAVDSAGNALVAGSLADSTGRRLGLLVKYSPDGEQVWSDTYRLDSDNWCPASTCPVRTLSTSPERSSTRFPRIGTCSRCGSTTLQPSLSMRQPGSNECAARQSCKPRTSHESPGASSTRPAEG